MTKNETKTFIQLQQYDKAVYYIKKLCVIFHQSEFLDVHGKIRHIVPSLTFA